jgi:signal peptidase I
VKNKQWNPKLQRVTERFLTWRKRRKLRKKEKQKRKNPVQDWAEAIISAVFIVLLINQYFLQAYQIPSQSMVSTLLIGDRLFVNKLVYGPELLPGIMKVPGFREPRRGEVIIFENPSYIPKGPVLDILQRVVYMMTLSLVDIDRDEYGRPRHQFLIKRAVGVGGDRLRMRGGEVEFLLPGEQVWLSEEEVKRRFGLEYIIRRQFDPRNYDSFRLAGEGLALLDAGLPVPAAAERAAGRYFSITPGEDGRVSWTQKALVDSISIEKARYRTSYALEPYRLSAQTSWRLLENGWYIPGDRIFPMGDNRDDSRDARYFGPVRLQKVLGRALFRYWPLGRVGGIR